MVSLLSSTKPPRILIGRSGTDGPFGEIADGLRTRGYQVTEWESSRIGAHSTEQNVRDQVKDIDLAFLVIREKDARDNGGPIRPLHRILVEAGLMQGKMELDRVVLLVEDSVESLSADTGLSSIRFASDRPYSVLRDVIAKIEMVFPEEEQQQQWVADPPPPGPGDRAPGAGPKPPQATGEPSAEVVDRGQSAEFWMAVKLAAAALLSGALVLALAALFLLGGDDDDDTADDQEAAATTVSDSADDSTELIDQGLARRTLQTQADASASGSIAESDQNQAQTEDSSEAVIGNDPAAPEATEGAADQLFPAICFVNMRKGLLIDGAIRCEGAGRLVLDGSDGPWHNEVAAVTIGEGVSGTVEFERRDDGSTSGPDILDLGVGTTMLDPVDAAFGILTLTLRFSGNDQHIHLFHTNVDGGQSATLTFSLDR